ncbi:unannotated protein [freshwater metagenome]|uniref:Unannotated protein n=1 Tax=freshwater metagenome TaxID=449393 RepID=A0A6J7VQX6_9ZZZZ
MDFPSAPLSKTVLFQPACGVIAFVIAGSETPKTFLATTLNVYEVPFFSPDTTTGLETAFFSTPVLIFLIMYSLICAVRRFTGGSNEMSAEASAVKACTFLGDCGRPVAIPAGGFVRISSIIARRSGPGSLKISPGSKLGVITESKPDFEKVASSK